MALRVMGRVGAGALVAILVTAAGAQAQSGERVVRSFTACRAVADPGERLACFDKAASALETAVSKKEVTILDRQDVRRTKRSLFGFTLPRIGIFSGDDDDEQEKKEFAEINTTVASARQSGYGRYEIHLADEEAVWQTTEPLPDVPRAGAKIRIRKGMLGNYFIMVDGRSVRGLRVR